MKRMARWAGRLHGGQLVMAVVGCILAAGLGAVGFGLWFLSVRDDREALASGRYCCIEGLTIDGVGYVKRDRPWEVQTAPDSTLLRTVAGLNRTRDSLRRAGVEPVSLEDNRYMQAYLESLGLERDYRPPRAWLEASHPVASTVASVAGLVLSAGFAFLAFALPWWWFGARRPALRADA